MTKTTLYKALKTKKTIGTIVDPRPYLKRLERAAGKEIDLDNNLAREIAGFLQARQSVKTLNEQFAKTNAPAILARIALYKTLMQFSAAYILDCVK